MPLSARCRVGYIALMAMKLAMTVVVHLWPLGARGVGGMCVAGNTAQKHRVRVFSGAFWGERGSFTV